VAAFKVHKATGNLTFINRVLSGAQTNGGPVHMEVDSAGEYAVVSLLGDGAVSVFPLRGEDGVGVASDVQQFVGIHQV
jgi:6-phosphogluconolactonase (cycloisomerase 2 family)